MEKTTFSRALAEYGFPPEACLSLSRDMDKLQKCEKSAALLSEYREKYAARTRFSFRDAAERLANAGKDAGVHPYASEMLFYLALAPQLRAFYADYPNGEELFFGAMSDLVCKAHECQTVFGVWGSFVAIWFSRFYDFSLFTLGRLEFCLVPCPFDCTEDGLAIKKGEPCIDVHIPSRERLTRASLRDAYARAAAFFAEKLTGHPTVFRCESWLLADFHDEMLPPDSGILTFAHDYRFRRQAPAEGDLWRIFGSEDTDRPETLSENTTLRRAYKARLCAKLPVYGGEGLFFYDHYPKGI